MKGTLGTEGRCAFAFCIAWEACLLENKETEKKKKKNIARIHYIFWKLGNPIAFALPFYF